MLKRKIRWVFFDMGATLIDETQAWRHRIRDMLAAEGITIIDTPQGAKWKRS